MPNDQICPLGAMNGRRGRICNAIKSRCGRSVLAPEWACTDCDGKTLTRSAEKIALKLSALMIILPGNTRRVPVERLVDTVREVAGLEAARKTPGDTQAAESAGDAAVVEVLDEAVQTGSLTKAVADALKIRKPLDPIKEEPIERA